MYCIGLQLDSPYLQRSSCTSLLTVQFSTTARKSVAFQSRCIQTYKSPQKGREHWSPSGRIDTNVSAIPAFPRINCFASRYHRSHGIPPLRAALSDEFGVENCPYGQSHEQCSDRAA